jgi:hypothetical protein
MASSSKGRASSRKQSSAGKARVISTKRKDALPRTGSVSAERRKPVVLPPLDAPTEPPAAAVAAPKGPRKKAHNLQQIEIAARRKKTPRAVDRASAKLDEPAAMEVAQAVAAVPEAVEVAAPAPVGEEVPAGAVEVPAPSAPASEPAMVTAPEPVAEPVADTVAAVEPSATAYEEFAVTPLEAPQVEALAVFETEFEVDASAIVEELPFEAVAAPSIAIGPPPIPEATRAPQLFHTTAVRPAPARPAPHRERRSLVPAVFRLLSTLSRWTGISGTK